MPTLRRMSAVDAPRTVSVRGAVGVLPLLVALSVAASLGAVLLVALGDVWALAPAPQVLVDVAVGATCPVVALVIWRSADHRARGLAVVLLVCGFAAAVTAAATALALALPATAPGVPALVQLQSWTWVPGFLPLLTLVPLLYPDGLPAGKVWRGAAVLAVTGVALLSVGVALYPEPFAASIPIQKPITSQSLATLLAVAGAICLVPASLAGLLALGLRLVRARGMTRRQVAVLLAAAAVLLAVTLAQGWVAAPWDVLAQAAAVVLVPVAIGVAVTRHGLYELDTAVRRSLVAGVLTVCLAGAYLTVFALLRGVLPTGPVAGAALAAGLTGALVQPLGQRLSAGVDRLYYGDRADPYAVVSRLTARLAEDLDPDRVPALVCRTVVEDLRLGGARLVVGVAGQDRVVAEQGVLVGDGAAQVALRHHGEVVGSLSVVPRAGEAVIDPRDAEILQVVADQTAPALAALRLRRELQHSRELLVTAREAERRRLRRDLHDGVGATLAGMRLQVESARDLVEEAAAQRLLDAAGAGLAQAVTEIRHVCENLRPPGIDDLGLVRALRMAADRVAVPGLEVDVEADDLADLGPAVEAATYRIVTESLANVVRHASARHVRVRLHLTVDGLAVEVADDGVGFRDGHRGVGIASMRQRAEELGGRLWLAVPTTGSGTVVHALLPTRVGAA